MALIDNLEKLLAAGRDDPMLRFGLGSAYFNSGDHQQAIAHLEACIEQDSGYTAAYKLLGRALQQTGRPDAAAEIYRRGLPVAQASGDKQAEKEMTVFLRKVEKQ